jgi:uncharacterized protein YkwD
MNRRLLLQSAGSFVMSAGLAACNGSSASNHGVGALTPGAAAGIEPLHFSPASGLAKLNAVRMANGRSAFAADSRLQKAAQSQADYMADTGKFGHEFGPSTRFPKRIAATGFDGSAGENIGVGYGSVDEALEGWLDSPKHRKILLRPNFDRVGIAYSFNRSGNNPRYTHFWVMIAGKARS